MVTIILTGCSSSSYYQKKSNCPSLEHKEATFLKGDSESDSIYITHTLKYHNDEDIDDIFVFGHEEDVAYAIFKEYSSNTKQGIAKLESKSEKLTESTSIYYIVSPPSLQELKNISLKEKLSKDDEHKLDEVNKSISQEISKDILDKVERLYLCDDVYDITINVGIISDEYTSKKPGEDVTKEPIEYIQYYEFSRDKVLSMDWENLDRENYYLYQLAN